MNCLEFRRELLAAPLERSVDLAAHRLSCRECAKFATNLITLEQQLKAATLVEVPEGLASKVLLRHRLQARSAWIKNRMAMALGSLAAALTLTLSLFWTAMPTLESSVLAHVQNELHHLDERNNVSVESVNAKLHLHSS